MRKPLERGRSVGKGRRRKREKENDLMRRKERKREVGGVGKR